MSMDRPVSGGTGGQEVEALQTLIETAIKLKESGILDMLYTIAEKSEELLMLLGNDVAVQRGLGLANAVQRGIEALEPEEVRDAKPVIEALTSCSVKALASTRLEDVKPKGLLGILGALRDKDVQTGLALMLLIAKSMGSCISRRTGQG